MKSTLTSDQRINVAIQLLNDNERGRAVLSDLKNMLSGKAKGLDTQGMKALSVLVEEFRNGRRDFVRDLA